MPAEWRRHRGTWLSWPHRESSWPGNFGPIPDIMTEMVRQLAAGEEVHINVTDAEMAGEVHERLVRADVAVSQVFYHHFPTNDAWCRDHGPIFVERARSDGRNDQLILDWGYNAWGGKYPPYDLDDQIPQRVGDWLDMEVVTPGMILEGGSIDVNGRGTLLTTESCLLNPNRNPELSKQEIETRLRDNLGVTKVLWLGDGIVGDDTDGHIDDISRFVDEQTIVTVVEADPRDDNYAPLQHNLRLLQEMTDQDGTPLRIVTLPMPNAIHFDGQRLPASYANFYIGNGVVLLPGYDPERDEVARRTLQACFPSRRVVPVDCTAMVWGLGAFHCLSQQWPATD